MSFNVDFRINQIVYSFLKLLHIFEWSEEDPKV